MMVPEYIIVSSNDDQKDEDEDSAITFIDDSICRWQQLAIADLDSSAESCLPKCPRRRRSKSRSGSARRNQRPKATGSPAMPKRKRSLVLSDQMLNAIGAITIADPPDSEACDNTDSQERSENKPTLPERRESDLVTNKNDGDSVAISDNEGSCDASVHLTLSDEGSSNLSSTCDPSSPQSQLSYVFGGGFSKRTFSIRTNAAVVHFPAGRPPCGCHEHSPLPPFTDEESKAENDINKAEILDSLAHRRLSDQTPPRQPRRKKSRSNAEIQI